MLLPRAGSDKTVVRAAGEAARDSGIAKAEHQRAFKANAGHRHAHGRDMKQPEKAQMKYSICFDMYLVLPCAGLVTTMATSEQLGRLQEIAAELELNITEQPEPPLDIQIDTEGDIETAKKGLDDLYNLL